MFSIFVVPDVHAFFFPSSPAHVPKTPSRRSERQNEGGEIDLYHLLVKESRDCILGFGLAASKQS